MHIPETTTTRGAAAAGAGAEGEREREGEGNCEQETKIYNFARHSAYKMSQQTTAGAGEDGRSRGSSRRQLQGCRLRRDVGAGSGVAQRGQAVKRQPPLPTPTTIRKQTNPPATTLAEMYTTSLSLCLLRATCASDVAMICIEVWHKKQNSSGQGEARQRRQAGQPGRRSSLLGCGAESYALPVFMTHMRRSGLGPVDLYLHTYTHAHI